MKKGKRSDKQQGYAGIPFGKIDHAQADALCIVVARLLGGVRPVGCKHRRGISQTTYATIRALLHLLPEFADDGDGKPHLRITQAQLAEAAGITESQAKNALSLLDEWGYTRVVEGARRGKATHRIVAANCSMAAEPCDETTAKMGAESLPDSIPIKSMGIEIVQMAAEPCDETATPTYLQSNKDGALHAAALITCDQDQEKGEKPMSYEQATDYAGQPSFDAASYQSDAYGGVSGDELQAILNNFVAETGSVPLMMQSKSARAKKVISERLAERAAAQADESERVSPQAEPQASDSDTPPYDADMPPYSDSDVPPYDDADMPPYDCERW